MHSFLLSHGTHLLLPYPIIKSGIQANSNNVRSGILVPVLRNVMNEDSQK